VGVGAVLAWLPRAGVGVGWVASVDVVSVVLEDLLLIVSVVVGLLACRCRCLLFGVSLSLGGVGCMILTIFYSLVSSGWAITTSIPTLL
jgi:hypothetical protein